MNNKQHKQNVTASFDMASEGYDCAGLRFFADSASWLADVMNLKGNENVLDVAAGTGHAALALARKLNRGMVTGIDLSEKMLQKAWRKALEMNLRNVTFQRRDIEDMGFEENSFDACCCAFGLFFVPDMENGLRCISRILKPGGMLALTSFTSSLMMPLRGMFIERIKKYGVEEPKLSWMLMDCPEKISSLLTGAGYRDIHIQSKQMGYYLKDSREWWDVLWNSGYRGLLNRLSEKDLEQFMAEHLKEVEGVADKNGIRLDVEVLLSTATSGK